MAKAPAFQFYPDDFLRDTQELSLAARGAWITLLCKMWYSVTPGRISWPMTGYARTFGSTVDQAEAVIDELRDFGICDAETQGDGNVTLINRRMVRDAAEKQAHNNRQSRYRERRKARDDVAGDGESDGKVTPYSSSLTFSLTSSSEDLKRLIDACVREHHGVDPKLVEIAVLETAIKWRRFGEKGYEPPPIKSIAYFADEIGHLASKNKTSGHTIDAMLASRRAKATRVLFGDDGGA